MGHGDGQGLGYLPMSSFRQLQRIQRLGPARCDLSRTSLEGLQGVFCFGQASSQVGNSIAGVAGSLRPTGSLSIDRASAMGAGGVLPEQRVAFRSGRGFT